MTPAVTRAQLGAVEALAEAWASIDGKLDEFRAANGEDVTGHRDGYLIEAAEMIERMERRGYTVVALDRGDG